jgi:putative ABC transport system ATP-binding protein
MVHLEKIIKSYRTEEIETTAINELDLEIKEGEFVAIMGPSGCGKSTLLNVVGMLDQADSGNYLFEGQNVVGKKKKELANIRKKNLGFIFQNFNLIDELSVFENVELPLLYNGVGSAERKNRVMETLEKMEIAHRSNHFPTQLSGGQQQRVAISRALVVKPKLILADEPTGNLDSKNGTEVMNLLKELNSQGATILMVTHSASDAKYADRTVYLKDGKVERSVSSDAEKINTKNLVTEA